MYSYASATDAVAGILRTLVSTGHPVNSVRDSMSVGSNFGATPRPTIEMVGSGFSLANPYARIASFKARRLNIPFAVANFLWTLFGDDDLEMISFYNDRARSFSPDGKHLVGSIGKRIFRLDGVNQFEESLNRLRRDPTTRRAVIQMFSPRDLVEPPLDTPCSASFQLLARDGELQWVTFMRSQSAAMVLPYDLFVFTMLQETAAASLQLKLGAYHHFCGSLHYYADEEALVSRILAETPSNDSLLPMPRMDVAPFLCLPELKAAEREMRIGLQKRSSCSFLRSAKLSAYWLALFCVVATMMQRRLGIAVNSELEADIPRPIKYLIDHDF